MSAAESWPDSDPELQIAVEKSGDVCTVRPPTSELDVFTAPRLRERLVEASKDPSWQSMVLETGGLTFIDATGLGVLVGALKRIKSQGRDLTIDNISRDTGKDNPKIRKAMEITGLDKVFVFKEPPTEN